MKLYQEITTHNNIECAILTKHQYNKLMDAYEDKYDIEMIKRVEASNSECFPGDLVFAISDGKNKVMAFREYRGFTVAELASAARVSQGYINQLEAGKRKASKKTLSAIAKKLNLDLDDLIQRRRK